ncbi:RluA family pseudouridine synthase [uncultured Vagococcus sp.]|uniref:RluA family pseudouridine synthase n=1 Tax=uncultured Vagococcus sp. TaxID=189676 RepID=UPI0028D52956|nr:RluA family pseudouridine synthase [uncultured Vagococcus sp.]
MQFSWSYELEDSQQIKEYIRTKGVSRGLLAKIKFQGGTIMVNQQVENVLYQLQKGDVLSIRIPDEGEHETLLLDATPIEVIFEDEHFLVVNKPTDVASIPAQYHPNGTMANRVKHYVTEKKSVNRVIHVVTRLDRDTTGLMLFAKHGFAHAMLDKALREKRILKKYQALVGGELANLEKHAIINLPIERDVTSILKRQTGPTGLASKTEYWLQARSEDVALVDIQLHTGRTHQIRVHFEAIGCPLLGDEMYHGDLTKGIQRQALHCAQLVFEHPFTQELIDLRLPLPEDMENVYEAQISR